MELSYIRVKWHGEDALSVKSKEITGIDSTVWTKVENYSKMIIKILMSIQFIMSIKITNKP